MDQVLTMLFAKKANRDRFMKFVSAIAKDDEEMKYIVYELATEYMYCNNQQQIVDQIRKKDILWNHPNFEFIRNEMQEEDDFLENPPEVEEGVMECARCHSKRTFSFSKQTRRADESATVFIRCSNCNYTYKI